VCGGGEEGGGEGREELLRRRFGLGLGLGVGLGVDEEVGAGGRVDYLKHGTQIWTHKPARKSPVDRKEPIYLRSGRILRAALVHSLLRSRAFAMSAGI